MFLIYRVTPLSQDHLPHPWAEMIAPWRLTHPKSDQTLNQDRSWHHLRWAGLHHLQVLLASGHSFVNHLLHHLKRHPVSDVALSMAPQRPLRLVPLQPNAHL